VLEWREDEVLILDDAFELGASVALQGFRPLDVERVERLQRELWRDLARRHEDGAVLKPLQLDLLFQGCLLYTSPSPRDS